MLQDRQPDAECTPRLRIRNVSIMCGRTWLHGFRSLSCCENMSRLVFGLNMFFQKTCFSQRAENCALNMMRNQRFCWGGVGC